MSEDGATSAESRGGGSRRQNTPRVELVRVIDRTIHVSPTDRTKAVDFTVRNPTDESFNFLFVPLRQSERNLEVHDEDGMRLNVYPNASVEDMLERGKHRDEAGYR